MLVSEGFVEKLFVARPRAGGDVPELLEPLLHLRRVAEIVAEGSRCIRDLLRVGIDDVGVTALFWAAADLPNALAEACNS